MKTARFYSLLLLMTSILLSVSTITMATIPWELIQPNQQKVDFNNDKPYTLIYVSAQWCGPCQKMEAETWPNTAVVAWMTQNAKAYKLDYDQNKAFYQREKLNGIPSMAIYQQGKLIEQVSGFHSAENILSWFKRVENGEREVDLIQTTLLTRSEKDKIDIGARMRLARKMIKYPKYYDQAIEEYLWLSQNMLLIDRAFVGVRYSYMETEMTRFANRYPKAKDKFSEYRNSLQLTPTSDQDEVSEWLSFNIITGETSRSLKWYDQIKHNPSYRALLNESGNKFFKFLAMEERWQDIGHFYQDPWQEAEKKIAYNRQLILIPALSNFINGDLTILYAGLLAVNDEENANKIAEALFEFVKPMQVSAALLDVTSKAGQIRRFHLFWPIDPESDYIDRIETALVEQSAR